MELRDSVERHEAIVQGFLKGQCGEETLHQAVKQLLWELDERQPKYLGCGCLASVHPNTYDEMKKNHPEVLGWTAKGNWYFPGFKR